MAPVFVAGGFNRRLCDVRLYSELYSGPLEDERVLAWPDMLVLSGLQVDFDRFLHLTAYARSLNPNVIVVAGGSLIDVLPKFCGQFFDYCCAGPVSEIQEVIREAFGPEYVDAEFEPRHDLAPWTRILGSVESSRNCNFHCRFCTMSIRSQPYQGLSAARVRREILQTGRRNIFFLDNNFYGNSQADFEKKIETLGEMRRAGELGHWAAELTADFFLRDRNLTAAKRAGCCALFCGVETFDESSLLSFGKRQNVASDQVSMIKKCLEAGIMFLYGLMLDPTRRSLRSLSAEIDYVLRHDEISLPSYLTLPIPLLGTPLFFDYFDSRAILPETRIRDLDCSTLALEPLDGLEAFAEWCPGMLRFTGQRAAILRHTSRFMRRYRRSLSWPEKVLTLSNIVTLLIPRYRNRARTFISTTEILDPQYRPAFRVASRFESYFQPVQLTDRNRELNPQLEELMRLRPTGQRAEASLERVAS